MFEWSKLSSGYVHCIENIFKYIACMFLIKYLTHLVTAPWISEGWKNVLFKFLKIYEKLYLLNFYMPNVNAKLLNNSLNVAFIRKSLEPKINISGCFFILLLPEVPINLFLNNLLLIIRWSLSACLFHMPGEDPAPTPYHIVITTVASNYSVIGTLRKHICYAILYITTEKCLKFRFCFLE